MGGEGFFVRGMASGARSADTLGARLEALIPERYFCRSSDRKAESWWHLFGHLGNKDQLANPAGRAAPEAMGLILIRCAVLREQRLGQWRSRRPKLLQQQQCLLVACLAGRTVQAVMTHLGKTLGQDVLEKAAQELSRGQAEPLDLLGAVLAVTKGHLSVLKSFQAGVAQVDAKHVAIQIFQHFLSATGRHSVDDPFLG